MKRILTFGAFGTDEHANYELRVYLHHGYPSGDLEVLEAGRVIWQQDLTLAEIAIFVAAANTGNNDVADLYMNEVELNIEAARQEDGEDL